MTSILSRGPITIRHMISVLNWSGRWLLSSRTRTMS